MGFSKQKQYVFSSQFKGLFWVSPPLFTLKIFHNTFLTQLLLLTGHMLSEWDRKNVCTNDLHSNLKVLVFSSFHRSWHWSSIYQHLRIPFGARCLVAKGLVLMMPFPTFSMAHIASIVNVKNSSLECIGVPQWRNT